MRLENEERFALDNNNLILDFEDTRPKYCLEPEEVCALLNKQDRQLKERTLDKQQVRNELIDEIIEGIEAKNINELAVIDRLAKLLEKLRNRRDYAEELKDN